MIVRRSLDNNEIEYMFLIRKQVRVAILIAVILAMRYHSARVSNIVDTRQKQHVNAFTVGDTMALHKLAR